MSNLWKIITLIFVGFILMGVILNAGGASKAMGTLFSGTASLGSVLEGKSATPVS